MEPRAVWSVDLGHMPYRQCADLQRRVLEQVAAGRLPSVLLRVEHPPVYTLGANFHAEHLPLPETYYAERGVQIESTDRGGDITYHGPGQLVLYPIFALGDFGRDLHVWLRNLEEATIVALREFGLVGLRRPPHTGAWIEDRKVCAIGIKVRRWTSMHGIALNVSNDLSPFEWIVPCGIREYGVTSLARELGRDVDIADAMVAAARGFEEVFNIRLETVEPHQLLADVLRHEEHAGADAHAAGADVATDRGGG